MSAELLQIADAVVTDLNAATLSQPVLSERAFLAKFDLQELKTLKVVVVPISVRKERLSRELVSSEYSVEIGILKKIDAVSSVVVDPLVELVQDVVGFFHGRRLTNYPSACCLASDPDPVYAAEHMEQLRQFTSVVKLTVKVL